MKTGENKMSLNKTLQNTMLPFSVVFLAIALTAAFFDFGSVASGAVEIAKLLFLIFAVLAIVGFVHTLVRKN